MIQKYKKSRLFNFERKFNMSDSQILRNTENVTDFTKLNLIAFAKYLILQNTEDIQLIIALTRIVSLFYYLRNYFIIKSNH